MTSLWQRLSLQISPTNDSSIRNNHPINHHVIIHTTAESDATGYWPHGFVHQDGDVMDHPCHGPSTSSSTHVVRPDLWYHGPPTVKEVGRGAIPVYLSYSSNHRSWRKSVWWCERSCQLTFRKTFLKNLLAHSFGETSNHILCDSIFSNNSNNDSIEWKVTSSLIGIIVNPKLDFYCSMWLLLCKHQFNPF